MKPLLESATGFHRPISLSHYLSEFWHAGPGQLFRGYYVSISLIISKSLDKQEGISLPGFDAGFFMRFL